MIDSSVSQLAAGFKGHWNNYLQLSPLLALDETPPSFGTVDLLTFPLRLKPTLLPEQERGIKGAAAYISVVLQKCWAPLFESVTAKLVDQRVSVSAVGGAFAPDTEVIVPVEEALRTSIRELPSPFPTSFEWKRPISFDSNIVSLFGNSLLSGLHPSTYGAWQGRTPLELKPATEAISRETAKLVADYYGRVFPQEPLGQVAELYLRGLIYPPLLADESLPASRAVDGILEFAKEFKVGRNGLAQLAANLTLIPDDLLSCAGIVLFSAISDRIPPPSVLCAAHTKGKFNGVLRHSTQRTRSILNLGQDWIITGLAAPAAKARFKIDEALISIPWLSIGMARLEGEPAGSKVLKLVQLLSEFEFEGAKKLCNDLVEETPNDVDLRIQRIRLTMVHGDYEQADSLFRSLLSEHAADASPRLFNLWGLCMLELKQIEKARSYFKAALAVIDNDAVLRPDVENNLGWTSMLLGDSMSALQHLESAAAIAPAPATALLNRAHVLWSVGEYAQAQSIRDELFKLAPTDRRVFAGLRLGQREKS